MKSQPAPREAPVFRVCNGTDGASLKILASVHRKQIQREPWPDLTKLDLSSIDESMRVEAAHQWITRANAEHGSVYQFSQLSAALSRACVPLEILGALSRLITDEIRHTQLCYDVAEACAPPNWKHLLDMPLPTAPWRAPAEDAGPEELQAWASRAILIACCLGESLSKPMLEVIALQATVPEIEAATRQILRDEELHSVFGWEALAYLYPRLSSEAREGLQETLASALGGFERTASCGFTISDLAGTKLRVSRSSSKPHLGTLTRRQSAVVFYSSLDSMIFPKLRDLGLDPDKAWAKRR